MGPGHDGAAGQYLYLFPMADEDIAARMYISKDGNYLEEAIVVVFKPTEDLAAMLREAAEGR